MQVKSSHQGPVQCREDRILGETLHQVPQERLRNFNDDVRWEAPGNLMRLTNGFSGPSALSELELDN